MSSPAASTGRARGMDRLLEIVSRLRGEGGCPWDREQTLETLKPYLIEESYETLDAVDSGDPRRHKDELGDVLLQVVLHARIREEEGVFTFDEVATALADKLVRRHPHVFGSACADTPEAVLKNWDAIKAAETAGADPSALGGIPRHLPALQKAQKVQSRAARAGFDWPEIAGVLDKLEEELNELRSALAAGNPLQTREELGDLLFSIVNLSRRLGVDAEEALQESVSKFVARFGGVERRVRAEGRTLADCTLDEMDAHWESAKAEDGARPEAGGRSD